MKISPMNDEARQPDTRNTIAEKPCRVIIDLESAKRMHDEIVSMKRAALNIELNAKRYAEHATNLQRFFSLIIE